MKMNDFKALTLEERLIKLNNHLLNLKNVSGRLEDKFKSDEFDFSYSLLVKNSKDLGIKIDGKNYVVYAIGEAAPVVKDEQSIVKQKKVVKQKQEINNDEKINLTKDEILFVKELFKSKQDVVNQQQMLMIPQFQSAKKTTGISVYVDIWNEWNDFKKQYPYSGTDLMALALIEFMEKYKNRSDS